MKALVLRETGVPPAVEEIETPVAKAGAALVRVSAAALNHRELWIGKGQYPGLVLPATLGADGAGTVVAVGEGVDAALVGAEVVFYPGLDWGADPRFPAADFGLLGMPGPGTIAEYILVPASSLFAKPAHLGFAEAASLALAGLTAWRGLVTKAALQSGERLLITGAGGGVGAQALQLAVAMGAEVWVTSGSDETIAWAKAQGAAGGINYNGEAWGKDLRKQGGLFDVVFDGAPAQGFKDYARALAMGARVVIYGSTGGPALQVMAPDLFLKNLVLLGTNVGNREEFADMLAFVSKHGLVPLIEKRFGLAEAASALDYLEHQHSRGKLVIDVASG